jgi:cytochrome c-type biogenesis protein CcmH/NrfG
VRAALGYLLLCAALAVYAVLLGQRGVLLVREGTWVTVPLGLAVLVLPLLCGWFLWRSTRFVLRAHRLARELEAEGGLPAEEPARTPSGRVDRAAADELFARRRAEAEAHPDDWRSWFRLAVAYHDARDTPRARKAMQHAIDLRAGRAGGPGRID